MAKILLAEDDNNLREIYEARLAAEGYEIVTAQNGEEALVVAKQNKPDLIISDVMMPRISGFEMLDILRNTPELQDTKVIMLTALGQAEDQSRAGKLGANKYLVKSQVTLEDIVNAAASLLADDSAAPAAAPEPTDPALLAPEPATEAPEEPAAAPAPAVETPPAPEVAAPEAPVEPAPEAPASTPEVPVAPAVETPPAPEVAAPEAPVEPAPAPAVDPGSQTAAAEEATVEKQIENFASTLPTEAPAEVEPEAPAAPEPAPENPAVATDQEALINEAVEDLTEAVNTPPEPVLPPSQQTVPGEEPAPEAPSEPAAEPAAATPVSQQVEPHLSAPAEPQPAAAPAPAPEPAAAQPEQTNDYQQVSGKKVIKPIGDSSTTGPNLDELLAKEAAKETTQTGPAATVGGEATTTPSVPATEPAAPDQAQQKPQSGVDPGSIAL